ncbi:conserved hypothetical protein [Gammaproteobacteria bacterium]
MQANPIFYKEIVPLDRNHHARLFLAPRTNYRYACATNSVFLAVAEFSRASHEYPIVFGDDGQTTFPLAILGLRDAENLFVTVEGKWNATYVPAYVRRYPFILSTQPNSDTLTVCIDRAYPNLNSEQEGLALFEEGRESTFLQESVDFLKDFQTQYALTLQFSTRLKDLGILESMQANVQLDTGLKLNMGGFFVVNRQRLINLSAEQIKELACDGTLELIYLHLNSLENFGRLIGFLPTRSTNNLANTPTAGSA